MDRAGEACGWSWNDPHGPASQDSLPQSHSGAWLNDQDQQGVNESLREGQSTWFFHYQLAQGLRIVTGSPEEWEGQRGGV